MCNLYRMTRTVAEVANLFSARPAEDSLITVMCAAENKSGYRQALSRKGPITLISACLDT